jgi:hypothetical protein
MITSQRLDPDLPDRRLSDLSRGAHFWATARLNQVPLVLSEDFKDGDVLEGVRLPARFSRTLDLPTAGCFKSEYLH